MTLFIIVVMVKGLETRESNLSRRSMTVGKMGMMMTMTAEEIGAIGKMVTAAEAMCQSFCSE